MDLKSRTGVWSLGQVGFHVGSESAGDAYVGGLGGPTTDADAGSVPGCKTPSPNDNIPVQIRPCGWLIYEEPDQWAFIFHIATESVGGTWAKWTAKLGSLASRSSGLKRMGSMIKSSSLQLRKPLAGLV